MHGGVVDEAEECFRELVKAGGNASGTLETIGIRPSAFLHQRTRLGVIPPRVDAAEPNLRTRR